MTEASTPGFSVADPFRASDASIINSTNTTRLATRTGFPFGASTTTTTNKSDDDVTKPVSPVSNHSPGQNDRSDGVFSAPPTGSASSASAPSAPSSSGLTGHAGHSSLHSKPAPVPSANLNPTGVFSTVPGLGPATNKAPPSGLTALAAPPASLYSKDEDSAGSAAQPASGSIPASTATVRPGLGDAAVGEKRKADSVKAGDAPDKPASVGSSVPHPLKATVEDFDSGAESGGLREPDAKKAKTGAALTDLGSASASAPAPAPDTAVTADKTSGSEATVGAAEETEKTEKKRGRPKKGTTEKKAPAPVGKTARKTRSQGPAA